MSVLDNEHDQKFFSIYSSLKNIYNKYNKDSKGCSGCKERRLLKQFKSTVESIEKNHTIILTAHPDISEEMFEFFMEQYKDRENCEDCIIKHLSTAIIFLTETIEGYTNHLQHAWSEIKQAYAEGFRERLDFNDLIDTKEKILNYLQIEDPDLLTIGALNVAEEFCVDTEFINKIRDIRKEIMEYDEE